MKTEIEEVLSQLIGLPLWGAGRAADLAWFQFGEHRVVTNRDGSTKTVGSWTLHIQSAWRIRDSKKVFVASSDCYMKADHLFTSTENFNWDEAGANQRDHRLTSFLKDKGNSLIVTKTTGDDFGGLSLELASNFYLEAFPDVSLEDFEHWRLFQPSTELPHFVVTTAGIGD